MKKLLILFFVFISTPIFATNIAVVEAQKVFDQSKQAKALQKQLEEEFAPRQKIIEGKQAELKLKVRNYEKNRLTLSDREVKEAEGEIIQLRQQYQKYAQQLQADLQKVQQKNIREIEQKIEKIVAEVAKKEGYDLVLFQGIAYHKSSINITDKVIKKMNGK